MNGKTEVLKVFLNELTFARVRNTVAIDDNLLEFVDESGTTIRRENTDFQTKRRGFRRNEWDKVERSYSYYLGFAESTRGGDIHFDSKGHSYQNENFCELGVFTKQHHFNPPARGMLIVGNIVDPARPHFCKWARCSEAERLFVEFFLGRKKRFSPEDLHQLYVNRHISEGKQSDRLVSMAMLLIARDLKYFLDYRERHGTSIDEVVSNICTQFGEESLWEQYVEGALEQVRRHDDRDESPQLYYSQQIPRPAPEQIKDFQNYRQGKAAGLVTPFADLDLKSVS